MLLCREAKDGRLDDSDRSRNLTGSGRQDLRLAVERREIEAEHPLGDGPWVFNQRALETDAAARFVERVHRNNRDPAIPASLQNGLEFPTT